VLEGRHPAWLRWSVGILWLVMWGGLIWSAHRPWEGLGGLVGERLRWLERFVLAAGWIVGAIVGATLGEIVRETRTAGIRRPSREVRWLLYPAGLVAALSMAALRFGGQDDSIGIVLVGSLTYCAGALSVYFGVGSYCRGEIQRCDEPGAAVDGASKVAYSSMARPTKSGMNPTINTPSG
jgi:hypothetical protein